jgi:predicted RNA methylase
MEFISKQKADEECGPADAIKPKEINSMLELARVSKKDIFYDLGSGNGTIVRTVVRKTKAHRAYGIEKDARRFCEAVRIAKENLTRRQLNRIDLWRAAFTNYDFSDATIIYNGLTEDQDEIELYKKQFQGRRVKIIKTDLPLVSYKPVASSFCKDVSFT